MTEATDTLSELLSDPVLAHEVLFRHRHSHPTPPFHRRLIRLIHSSRHHRLLLLCFRGSGKSTLLEEAITLLALTASHHNILIIGESWLRACDRLRSIRRELESNEELIELFGTSLGPTWQEGRVILSNGVAVTASGAGQALRGTKHLEHRPDLCVVDDLESIESASSAEQRRKLADWFYADLLPALDPSARLILLATPLHPQSLASSLLAQAGWHSMVVPVTTRDAGGTLVSQWPERFPLDAIAAERESYARAGKQHRYAQEFDMVAREAGALLFASERFRFDPLVVFDGHPAWIAIDPARTVRETSATTGVACASWIGRRLVVWEAVPCRITPSELVDLVFRLDARYAPIAIGVERDGLEEFLLQPLRHAMLTRSKLIPLRALKAPRGKDEFIARLQPLFQAGDIVFAGTQESFAEALEQFLSFPFGLKDVPNALAYLFEMREGIPVYEDAGLEHRVPGLSPGPGPVYLALNATAAGTAAVLFQYAGRVLTVLRDWVAEGDAGMCARGFVDEAALDAGRRPKVIVPPAHFDAARGLGLLAALRGAAQLAAGGEADVGRAHIRALLSETRLGVPRLLVDAGATWVTRALFGGYCRLPGQERPADSLYACLMQALEHAVALACAAPKEAQRTAALPSGERYATAEVDRRRARP